MNHTKRSKTVIAIAAASLVFFVFAFARERSFAAADALRLTFLDVGQGDAALIRTPDGHDVLIDAGPDDAVLAGLSRARPWWDRTIETMIVTHLDADHYMGLFGILEKYEVGEVRWNGAAPTTDTARRLVDEIGRRGIPQRVFLAGERIELGSGRYLEAIYPFEDVRGRIPPKAKKDASGGTNDWSVVTRLVCGGDVALMTGDISSAVEARLVASGTSVAATVLKVAHHGSAHSSSEAFLDAVRPEEAVISSGAGNRYGHPTVRVLKALETRNIAVRRTDREGDVSYVCDGGGLHGGGLSAMLPASN